MILPDPGFRCAGASVAARRAGRRHRLDGARVPAGRARRAPGATTRCATPGCPTTSGRELRRRAAETGVRVLLVRRPGRPAAATGTSPSSRRTPIRTGPGWSAATVTDPHDVLDLDLAGLRAGRSPGLEPTPSNALLRLHPRPARRLLRRARPPGRAALVGGPSRGDLGGLAHRRRPVRRQPAGAAARALLRAARRAGRGRRRRRATRPASSTSTTCAAGPGYPMPVQAAEIALRRELGETRNDALRLDRPATVRRRTAAVFDVGGARAWDVVRSAPPGASTDPADLPGRRATTRSRVHEVVVDHPALSRRPWLPLLTYS